MQLAQGLRLAVDKAADLVAKESVVRLLHGPQVAQPNPRQIPGDFLAPVEIPFHGVSVVLVVQDQQLAAVAQVAVLVLHCLQDPLLEPQQVDPWVVE